MKYLIKARLEVDGRVEVPDIIGAIFGQTEGLLGSGWSLEELQQKDKIGRVRVDIKYQGTKTVGYIYVPSNLDRVHTSIIAAMLETVDKIGPYNARIVVEEIKDLRAEKLKKIIARARELLREMKASEPDIKEIVREVLEGEPLKPAKVIEYGPDKLPAGPGVEESDTVIVVEGRGDVVNLLRYGYTNVIALEGAKDKVPETIKKLAEKGKKIILFVDGDRGGELILKNVLPQLKVDYVARAPQGKEVEELTGKEIARALAQMVPASKVMKDLGIEVEKKPEEAREKPEEPAAKAQAEAAQAAAVAEEKREEKPAPPKEEAKPAPAPAAAAPAARQAGAPAAVVEAKREAAAKAEEKPAEPSPVTEATIPKKVIEEIENLRGTLEAILYDRNWNEIERIKVKELFDRLQKAEKGEIYAVVFDGIITQRLLDVSAEKGVSLLIGSRMGSKINYKPGPVKFLTFSDLI